MTAGRPKGYKHTPEARAKMHAVAMSLRNGSTLQCVICGSDFYRKRSYIERGITNTCGKSECKSKFFSGSGNSAWGRIPTEAMRKAVTDSNLARPKRRSGPPPGWKPSAETRAALSAALKQRWLLHRDKMIAALTKDKPLDRKFKYRREFTPYQKRVWRGTVCAWCETTDDLELDHIIPVVIGGLNMQVNSQTLCRKCNLWKMAYIDRPQYVATLASKAAS